MQSDQDPAGPLLQVGDRVAIVSPAGPSSPESLERGRSLLEAWGLETVTGEHAGDRDPALPYLAGADRDRADDLQKALLDPTIDAVFAARGGYGCLRLLDLLDVEAIAAASPKAVVGSSDVTALHGFFDEKLRRSGVFAPMVATGGLLDDATAQASLHDALFESRSGAALGADDAETLVPGEAHGRLVGGNLSLLSTTTLAKPGDIVDNRGCIGMIEDVHEAPYRIDHMITGLRRAGWFDGLVGLAFGSWTDCPEQHVVRAFVEEAFGDLGIPIAWDLGFGHCDAAFSYPTRALATLRATPDAAPRLILD